MNDPTRWSDPRGGAPSEVQRLLASARGGAPPLPEAVRDTSSLAVAALGSAAKATAWGTALKVIGALSALGVVGVAVAHRAPIAAVAPARPTPTQHRLDPARPPAAPTASPAPPAPVVPVAAPPAPAHRGATVERPRDHETEVAMLERARELLAAGEAPRSLAVLRDHSRRYPSSALAEERDYLRFRAAARGAPPAAVAREAERFLRRHPEGIYSSQVRAAGAARE